MSESREHSSASQTEPGPLTVATFCQMHMLFLLGTITDYGDNRKEKVKQQHHGVFLKEFADISFPLSAL